MNKTVKNPGGVVVRVITTLNDFKAKYGYWPETIKVQPDSISALATHHLTPFGFFLLQSKVDIQEGPVGDIVAIGTAGHSYSYSEELGRFNSASNQAEQWLGLDLDGE